MQNRTNTHGICFYGDRATLVVDRNGYEVWEEADMSKSAEKESNPRFYHDGKPGNEVDGPLQRLFVDCVKNGKKPPLELEEGHRATACCHLANIAYLTGRKLQWNGEKESIADDPRQRVPGPPAAERLRIARSVTAWEICNEHRQL